LEGLPKVGEEKVIDRGKHDVLGIRIDAVDYKAAVERIIKAAREEAPLAVSALAVHGVMTGVADPVHRYRLNQFDLLVPDGQPVRWALNLMHRARLKDRVYGPNLMLKVCERAVEERLAIFLFGGSADLLAALTSNLQFLFPRLRIAGTRPSLFRRLNRGEQTEMATQIRKSGAQITFIGLGCPRQEVCAYELREALSMPVLAVGAAFNFHAGKLVQAPEALQKWGLEWLFRLLAEPRRLWKRYLLLNPAYLALMLLQLTGLYKLDPKRAVKPTETICYG
jgi:N-acetylglucosaminyldiphosphoundecaprenol N-acetyl-beta-D-mannosaminyltransferase